ncbi:chromate transporter [Selenomonas sp. TAMA-11512]|uniref:chromate transporter n=1 Tax=Selenomonas sp. TAMA-11512 TaxID=3095337 RepID=UPI0030873B2A|nr:chromate transporter [Selenomonas sp. TAMA-11512]
MIYLTLFYEFAKVSIFCVGGGYASMPLIQTAVIDNHAWMTLPEFIDIFTISQMTPGPIGINAATFAGLKVAGVGGAVAATAGFVTPSLILGIFLARLFFKYGGIGVIRGILNGLRPAVIALIAGAALDFILLAVWNSETLPGNWEAVSSTSVFIICFALAAQYYGYGVITTLLASGALGLFVGFLSMP